MGVFDSVRFDCPNCKAEKAIEAQSKAGECSLRLFDPRNVPVEIAVDLFNQNVYCYQCNHTYKIDGNVPTYVSLHLREGGKSCE
ncbi:MAG: hypothetical protein ACXABY_20130 [Candidatus Thorarchaeota archaeon]|jgi:uncharacterized protein YbaR (Trm112 family)